jgi:hypothetical protein
MTIAAVIAAPKTRARASNNPRRLEGVDGRSSHGRRRRDVIDGLVAALGGPDCVTDPVMSDIVRAADLTLIAERTRADALRGGAEVSVSDLIRLEGAADRAVRRLNLPSDQKHPTGQNVLAEYLATSNFQVPDDAADDDEPALEPESATIR